MKIKNHRLEGAEFRAAHSSGGEMRPRLIILHDTAGRLDKGSSVNWFCSDECNTSAHIVVERDGTIVQQVPFDRKAFHAGASVWKGEKFCNGFAIGIEIVNPGKLDKDGRAWFHKKTERGFPVAGLKRVKTAQHGDGWWLDYTAEQIEAVTNLCKALVGSYPDIADVTAHFVVSPGRKIDVNPLFPLDEVRRAALSVKGEIEVAEVEPAGEAETPAAAQPIKAKVGFRERAAVLQETIDMGSRLGTSIRNGLNTIYLLLFGGTAITTTAATMLDTKKGNARVATEALSPYPVLMIAIFALLLGMAITGGVAWYFFRGASNGLVTAWRGQRYLPPKQATPDKVEG